MRKRLNGMLAILLLAVCFPSMAKGLADSICETQGGTVPLKSVNLKMSKVTTGKILYTSPAYAISYTCTVYPSLDTDYVPTLAFPSSFIEGVIKPLGELGLGINLTIQEAGQGPVTIPWSDLKNGKATTSFRKKFGAAMATGVKPLDKYGGSKYSRDATVSVELFVEAKFVQRPILILDIPSMDALNIIPADGTAKWGKPVRTGAFSIRFLPENLGRVSVRPSLVRLGRFYKTVDSTLSKTAAFTVTAQQETGTSTPFTVPLMINFIPTAALAITDEQYIQLTTGGQNNGLRLSVRDNATGNNVKFNTPASMGSLEMTGSPGNSIQKTYTAVVDRIPGTDLKTGDFSASMSVVVTYN
ncbi:fimbrial protein [Salmonella enterica]|uniref:fimbrial protein n=1 Tax=Salmonella sp. SAL04162 TaxID=3159782 RepID=UPI002A2253F7|nr:fimbrial protein [Salmonella enterica]